MPGLITYFIRKGCRWVRVSSSVETWARLPHVSLPEACRVASKGLALLLAGMAGSIPPVPQDLAAPPIDQGHLHTQPGPRWPDVVPSIPRDWAGWGMVPGETGQELWQAGPPPPASLATTSGQPDHAADPGTTIPAPALPGASRPSGGSTDPSFTPAEIPEPYTFAALAVAVALLLQSRRRR